MLSDILRWGGKRSGQPDPPRDAPAARGGELVVPSKAFPKFLSAMSNRPEGPEAPVLIDFSSTDFRRVLELVPVGYAAVMEQQAQLAQLVNAGSGTPQSVPGMQEPSDYVVQFVDIDNASVLNDQIIRTRLAVKEGEVLDVAALEQSINNIYSLDVFQSVTYDLVRNDIGQTGIEVTAIPRNWGPNYLQFGMEISDDFSGNTDFSN